MQMERYCGAAQHTDSNSAAVVGVCLWFWWCHFTLQNLFLYYHVLKRFSRAVAVTLQTTIRAVKLIHYEDENPNLNILLGAGLGSAWLAAALIAG